MIVLDTNQLYYARPGTPILKVLSTAANRTGHSLAITDVVLWESLNQHRQKILNASGQLSKAHASLKSLVRPNSLGSLKVPDVALEVAAFEADVLRVFRILETSGEDAREALRREARRMPPCKVSGEGGRDTSIWLTTLRAAEEPDVKDGAILPTILVSADGGFTDSGSEQLVNMLAEEAATKGIDVVLHRNVVAALAAIGTETVRVDPADVGNRPEVLSTLASLVSKAPPLMLQAVSVPEQPVLRTFVAGEIIPKQPGGGRFVRNLAKPESCRVGDYTVTCITGIWHFSSLGLSNAAGPSWANVLIAAAAILSSSKAALASPLFEVSATVLVESSSEQIVHVQPSGIAIRYLGGPPNVMNVGMNGWSAG